MRKTMKRVVSGLLCLAMVLCMLPTLESRVKAQTGYDRGYDGGMAGDGRIFAHGLDVSAWEESGLNFYNIANAGYDYVILRCGTSFGKDKCFDEFYANAKAAGLDVGCYYYSYATSAAEARAEAYDMISWMGNRRFEYPIYFDYEDPSQSSIAGDVAAQICYAFLDTLRDAGYLVGIYSMASWLEKSWVTTCGLRDTYEGWVAHLTTESDNSGIDSPYYDDLLGKYGTRYGMHQYSFTTWVNGVGPFDCNVSFKDYPAIVQKYGFNGYESINWEYDGVGRRYRYDNGTYAVGWTHIDGAWYYFSASTYMYTGWYYDEGYKGWYFFDPTSGVMQTGFIFVDGYHYYMDSSGRMLLGWQKIDGYWYYFNTTEYWPAGAMFTGWHEIDGEYYFFSETTENGRGRMQTGWVAVDTDWYYCNSEGVRQYGWQNIDDAWYYLTEPHGIMAERAWIMNDGEWCYVNADGARVEGATWTEGGTYEDALDLGTEFYATIEIPATGTRAGIDSDETSSTYRNLEVQAVRDVEAGDYQEQLWYFVRREDGSYRITNVATGLCLDVEGGYVEKGTDVRVWTGNDAIAQRWFIYQEGENYGLVSACNAWDKTVLDIADGLAAEGTDIRIWSYNGSVAQQFMINPIEEKNVLLGDVDCNGVIDSTDYLRIKAAFLQGFELNETERLAADVDQNGVIDTTDYMKIKAYFLGTDVIE